MDSVQNKKAAKKEKPPLLEFESQVKDIRQQFLEQVKCLEIRTENQTSLLSELQDFYKRRADIELDHSKNLDKLSKHLSVKQKAEKQKREGWTTFSLYNHYLQATEEVKNESKHRSALADLYLNHICSKLTNEAEELQRISKKCREISVVAQQEILRVLGELHTAMKTYQLCQAASWAAENKFRAVEAQKCRFEEANPKKIGRRKHRFLEKEYEKKRAKYTEFKMKALKAKNEYLLCIDAANAALHKYFADDLSDLLDCMDVGCEEWLKYLLSTLTDCRQAVLDSDSRHVQVCRDFARDLDHRTDKRRFLDANHSTFMLPRKFEFKPHMSDAESPRVRAQKSFQEDYTQRYWQISHRLTQLKTETEEIWKTLETAEKTLMDIQKLPEIKWPDLFSPSSNPVINSSSSSNNFGNVNGGNNANNNVFINANSSSTNNSCGANSSEISRRNSCRETDASQQKRKQDLYEIEDYYLQKFKEYLIAGNLIRRLEARQDAIRCALGVQPVSSSTSNMLSVTGMSSYSASNHNHTGAGSCDNSRCQSASGENGAMTNQMRKSSVIGCSAMGTCESSPSPILHSDSSYGGPAVPVGAVRTRRKKRIGVSAQSHARKRPKLFGGSIEEYVEATGQDIPLVIRSCVRMLSLHGLHHQGVFRVSGSQIEINCFRDAFERGQDPLADVTDSSDVNSVAGVLKLYFRELREPLFPIFMFDQFVECSRIENKDEFGRKVQELVLTLPRPVFVVMRYLFSFLNHLSEFSDENMMDPFNLAICFGPTLLPIPESRDQVFYHNHVNELMKNMIIYHEEIFPKIIGDQPTGLLYEKYLLASDNIDETAGVASLMPVLESKLGETNGGHLNFTTRNNDVEVNEDEVDDEETYEDDEDVGNNTDYDEQDDIILPNFSDQSIIYPAGDCNNIKRPLSQNGMQHSTPGSKKDYPNNASPSNLHPSYDSSNPGRRRSVSAGCAPVASEDIVDLHSTTNLLRDLNTLSMHDSLRAIDSPQPGPPMDENKIANTDVVWHRRQSSNSAAGLSANERLLDESGQLKSPIVKEMRSSLFANGLESNKTKLEQLSCHHDENSKAPPENYLRSKNDPIAIVNPENSSSLYFNLPTSVQHPANRYPNKPTERSSQPSPTSLTSSYTAELSSSSNGSPHFYSRPQYGSHYQPTSDFHHQPFLTGSYHGAQGPRDYHSVTGGAVANLHTSMAGKTSYPKPLSESFTLKQHQNNHDDTGLFRVSNKTPIYSRYSVREIEERLKNLSFNNNTSIPANYGINRGNNNVTAATARSQNICKAVMVQQPPAPTFNPPSPSPKRVTSSPVTNYSSLVALPDLQKCDSSDICHHYPPAGHSPTSLKEIQVELKAVLSSLESFASQHQRKDIPSTNFDPAEIERRFGLRGYAPDISAIGRRSGTDAHDIQRNNESTTCSGRNLVVSPPDLVQNLPLPGPVNSHAVDHGLIRPLLTSHNEEPVTSNNLYKMVTKPPVPRKPSTSSISSSPQISRRGLPDESTNNEPPPK